VSRQATALETALSLATQHQAVFDELGAQEALRWQQMAKQARMLQNLYNDHISEQQKMELEQQEQQRQLAQLAEQRQDNISEQQRRESEQEEQQRQHDISEQQRRELEQEEQQRQLSQLTEQRQQEEEQRVQRQQEEEARQVRLEALRLQHLENEERRRIQDQELAERFLALFQQRERERLEELEYERENRDRVVAEAELQWQQRVQNLSAEELERQLEAEESERDHYLQSQHEAQQYQENRAAEWEARQAWEAELAAVVEAIQQDLDMEEDEDENADEAPDVPENPIPRRYTLPKGRRPYTDPAEQHYLGPMNVICSHCRALHFDSEKLSTSTQNVPKFGGCCIQGQVKLPEWEQPPLILKQLLCGVHPLSDTFRKNIRQYNAAFAFTSLGVKVDNSVTRSSGPYSFRIHGGLCHQMGSLLPENIVDEPSFAQLYVHDPAIQLGIRARRNPNLHPMIMSELQAMIHNTHPYVPLFKQAFMIMAEKPPEEAHNVQVNLHVEHSADQRRYNLPTANEIAAIVPGDGSEDRKNDRDIVLHVRSGGLR